MQTAIQDEILGTAEGQEADAILRACVHCGFCTATCPTYQLLGDELDGPRGRIYQIKQVLEGHKPTRITQVHLDRCLSCRACETTCPSGVRYARLADIGRALVERQVKRPLSRAADPPPAYRHRPTPAAHRPRCSGSAGSSVPCSRPGSRPRSPRGAARGTAQTGRGAQGHRPGRLRPIVRHPAHQRRPGPGPGTAGNRPGRAEGRRLLRRRCLSPQ